MTAVHAVGPGRLSVMARAVLVQAVEAYQENRSPGPMSMCSPACLSCSTATPPCPCTIPLGNPVVPEE